jgi:hypothetical protein
VWDDVNGNRKTETIKKGDYNMSNFLEETDGDFLPFIQWGSDAVQWSKKGVDGKEVFQPTTAIFDLENTMVGWIAIQKGSVDKVLVPHTETPPSRPEGTKLNQQGKEVPLYDKGFAIKVLFGKEFGETRLYEFSTSQKGSLAAVKGLMAEYKAQKDANVGKVPVVTFGAHRNEKRGVGSTNIPGLNITSWVDRPAELDGDAVAEVAAPVAQAASGSQF